MLISSEFTDPKCLLDFILNYKGDGSDQEYSGCFEYVPIATSLMFELIRSDISNKYFIRVNFNGAYIDYCKLGKQFGEKYDCPVEEFNRFIDERIPGLEEYEDFCLEKDIVIVDNFSNWTWFWFGLIVIFLVGAIEALWTISVKKDRIIEDYRNNSFFGKEGQQLMEFNK